MENKSLRELNANLKNPRTINKDDYKNLVQSIRRFGDLSGIVYNVRTGQLVGGHQRQKAFGEIGADNIEITQKYEQPNGVGTVAVGHVMLDGERYGYREVDWDATFEKAANVAANRIQGEFDNDLLAEITYEIAQAENPELLELTGQTQDEIDKLLRGAGVEDEEKPKDEIEENSLKFSLTREQREVVEEALGHLKATREMVSAENSSMNGNALYYMARDYLDRLHGMAEAAQPQPAIVEPDMKIVAPDGSAVDG